MMKKRLFITCVVLGIVCVGCGDSAVTDNSSNIHVEETTQESTDEKEELEKAEDVEQTEEQEKAEEEFNLFDNMKDREFYFSSGAGGWRTIMHIKEDGSFLGEFSDSDMGSVGEGYPNGTYYICTFKGKFTKPVKVNDYTYSAGIANISYEKEPGTEEIIDGVLFNYSEPYGIEGTNSLLIYLPEAPIDELPQEYLEWVRYEVSESKDGKLSFYGIYNEKEQNGFSSYEILNPVDELMTNTKKTSDFLKESMEKESLTQLDMNEKSKELFDVWDRALNTLWSELKSTLEKDEFEILLNEQRAWIKEKENEVEKAASDVAGGSMEPLVRNMTAAELTEKRVYELYELLK